MVYISFSYIHFIYHLLQDCRCEYIFHIYFHVSVTFLTERERGNCPCLQYACFSPLGPNAPHHSLPHLICAGAQHWPINSTRPFLLSFPFRLTRWCQSLWAYTVSYYHMGVPWPLPTIYDDSNNSHSSRSKYMPRTMLRALHVLSSSSYKHCMRELHVLLLLGSLY